jgi:hypothetical protein
MLRDAEYRFGVIGNCDESAMLASTHMQIVTAIHLFADIMIPIT